MQCWKWLAGAYLRLMPDARGSCCRDNKACVWQVTRSLPVGWQEKGGTCLMDQVLLLMGKAVRFLVKQSVAVHPLWFSAKMMPKCLVRPFMLPGSDCTRRHLLTGKTTCKIKKTHFIRHIGCTKSQLIGFVNGEEKHHLGNHIWATGFVR
jgi:hypothetical protein